MAAKGGKKAASSNRTGSASGTPRDQAASVAASTAGLDKRQKVTIWPEWNDADVNLEKWDVAHKGKDDKKGKSPTVVSGTANMQPSHSFEDPDGKLDMPQSLRVDHWKRPQDYIGDKIPSSNKGKKDKKSTGLSNGVRESYHADLQSDWHTDPSHLSHSSVRLGHHVHKTSYQIKAINGPMVVDTEFMANDFDLITQNEHLHESELMRSIISQIHTLWELCKNKTTENTPELSEDPLHSWKPWEHIFSMCKVAKHHIPLFNPHGKYLVRLYWMGCWRKIMVDDFIPFDENDQMLLPASAISYELWPMLLTKALIKIASLDYSGGNPGAEFGDIHIIHCLTGWLPEAIPLQHGHLHEVWKLLTVLLPQWHLPETEHEKTLEQFGDAKKEGTNSAAAELSKEEKVEATPAKEAKTDKEKGGKDKAKEKDKAEKGKEKDDKKDKKDKGQEKDKDKNKEKIGTEEPTLPEKPEVVVFARFGNIAKYPVKVSLLGEMADASERLRQNGLSHMYPHPVCITQTRTCPLEPPPVPEHVPAWKLIRPRQKRETPTDEPKPELQPPKEIQCIEICSPFINYKVSPVPIPTDTSRPKSSLARGSTRSRPGTGNVEAIEETDEHVQELEIIITEQAQPDILTLEAPLSQQDEGGLSESKGRGMGSASGSAKQRKMSTKRDRSLDGGEGSGVNLKVDAKAGKGNVGASKINKSASKRIDSRAGRDEEHQLLGTKLKGKGVELNHKVSPPPTDAGTGAFSLMGAAAQGLESTISLPADVADGGEDGDADLHGLHHDETRQEAPKQKKRWMDFDQFCICFRTLYIFHKPNTYLCNQRYSDLRNVTASSNIVPPSKGEKKTAATALGGPPPEDKSSLFLFVDNLKPTEIVISFSVLSRWLDVPVIVEEKKGKGGKDKDKELDKDPMLIGSLSLMEGAEGKLSNNNGSIGREHVPPPPVTPGTLVAEPYSWKSLVIGQPVLRLRTTGTKAAVLSLPAGRHVLRFMMTSPLGHHVYMCSTVNFVFGDEETVMPQLTNESCRFRDNALQVMSSLGKCISCMTDPEQFTQASEQLVALHCPFYHNKQLSKQKHFQNFNEALYNMLRKALRDVVTQEIAMAWRALTFDVTTPNILGLQLGSRPESPLHQQEASKPTGSASARGSAKPGTKKPGADKDKGTESKVSEPEKTENIWATRYMEPTPEEHVAAIKIEKVWRGYWVRKVNQARTPGTEENIKAQENVQKAWAVIEAAAEENGLLLFREMFKRDVGIMQYYPFYKDEWNKITYADYKGIYPEQPSNTWFLIFREVFFVKDETLMVPKLYVAIPTCMMRVIDNDTGEQLPTVFQKVAPYVYKRNKRGYTFMAEARTTEQPLQIGAWRMRLIGSFSPLPAPRGTDVNSNFVTKDFRDYYVPNANNIIFRYSVKVTEEQLCSLQVCTSKYDVNVHLAVLDWDQEIARATGKGHVVIPAFTFHKDSLLPGEEGTALSAVDKDKSDAKRSNSRTSNRGATKAKGLKRAESAGKSPDGRVSRGSQHSDQGISEELDEKDLKPHKYVVQATVLRNSWPLSESSWAFIQQLKELEKNELKVAYRERAASPLKNEKSPTAGQKSKPKGKLEKGNVKEKTDAKGSRPPSQQFDITKPHWTLRIVVDANLSEEIEVKKDTERADEIRAIKKAWEDAEPGRAAKALQSRLKYLSTHTIKLQQEEEEEAKEMSQVPEGELAPPQTPLSAPDQDVEVVLTLEPPPPQTPKEMLMPLDITPFVRKTLSSSRLLDEVEMQRMLEERQRQIAEYKELRREMEEWRAADRAARNRTKIKQLDDAQALQLSIDQYRELVNVPREKFRQKYLEAERLRQEELAALEALKTDHEGKADKGRKSAKDKAAGKKKK